VLAILIPDSFAVEVEGLVAEGLFHPRTNYLLLKKRKKLLKKN
jgi:hypothetical protein